MTTNALHSKNPEYARRYAKFHRHGYRLSVSAIPSTRKVQALHAIGYTRPMLMEFTGFSKSLLYCLARGNLLRLSIERADRLDRVYQHCKSRPRDDTGARKVRSYARKNGWAVPYAWDDIDDPNDYPKGMKWAA